MTQSALADTVEVRRVDGTIALVAVVKPDQLRDLDPDEPLMVLAAFEEPRAVNEIRRALGKAADDVLAGKHRREGAGNGGGARVAGGEG